MDKIQITKIALQPKIGLVKKEKPNGPQKNEPKRPKTNWPILHPIIAYLLRNLALINHISLVSTQNCDPFEALDSWFPNLQNICFCPKNITVGSPDFELKSKLLCCHALWATLIQSAITLSFQIQITNRLWRSISDFISFKKIGSLPQETHRRLPWFWVKVNIVVQPWI